jgi:hypothetical protein
MFKKYLSVFIFLIFSFSIFTNIVLADPTEGFIQAKAEGKSDQEAGEAVSANSCGNSWNPLTVIADCGTSLFLNLIIPVINFVVYWIMRTVNGALWYLVDLIGTIMDVTIYYTVVQFTVNFVEMGQGTDQSGQGGLIYYAWSIVRDILNAGVFFVIIYHAILSMFNGFADVKKKFISLLMFVVLVNFSLLFVKLIADVSNIAVLQIYQSAVKVQGSENFTEFTTPKIEGQAESLSSFLLESININADRTKVSSDGLTGDGTFTTGSAIYQIARMFIYIYFIFLFLFITSIFLTRAATFIIIMICSPLLVVGSFFSGFKEQSQKVKDELIEEALQGPAIVFFLVISGLIGYSLFQAGAAAGLTAVGQDGAVSPLMTNLSLIFRVAFFAAFNFYAFKMVREMSTRGSNLSEKLFGAGLGLAFGATAWGARKTIGGLGNKFYNSDNRGRKWADQATDKNASRLSRGIASAKLQSVNFARNSTFDGRTGVSAMQKTFLGAKIIGGLKTGLPMNLDFGKGSDKTAFSTQKKKDEGENKRRDDYRKVLSEAGQRSWTISDASLINKGLVTAEHDGKETDIRDLRAMSNIVSNDNFKFKNDIRSRVVSGRGDEKIEFEGKTMSANGWQELINEDKLRKDKKNVINQAIEGVHDDATVYVNGENKSVREWKKEIEEEGKKSIQNSLDKAEKKLKNGIERSGLVEKYQKKNKSEIEKDFDNLQGRGEIKYMSEIPNRLLRASVRKLTGEQRDGGDFRADAAAKKRYGKATDATSSSKDFAGKLVNQAASINEMKRDFANNTVISNVFNTTLNNDFAKLETFGRTTSESYLAGIDGKSVALPKTVRDEQLKAQRNIAAALTSKRFDMSTAEAKKVDAFISSLSKLETAAAAQDKETDGKSDKGKKEDKPKDK